MSKPAKAALFVDKAISLLIVLASVGKLVGIVDLSWTTIMLPVFVIYLTYTLLGYVGRAITFLAD